MVRIKAMKKVARAPPGLLVDIAMLKAMAENFLDILEEQGEGPENPRVWKRPLIKRNKKGEDKTYYRWYCSWHDGNKTVTEYLGSCRKMSEAEALEKAKRLKAEALPGCKTTMLARK
jgi:hypothetical protein